MATASVTINEGGSAAAASLGVTEFADKHLRTIGTDLHDGPAQVDQLCGAAARPDTPATDEGSGGGCRRSTAGNDARGALSEIRSIALALVC